MTVADTVSLSIAPAATPAAGSRWQRVAASPAALAVTLSALAFGVRSIGLTRAFELWVDEMLYADLGASVSRGELPRLPDGPFFLHPPGFFLLEGGVIKLFGLPTADSMNLVYDLRWLSAALGALTIGLVFLLIRRVAGTWPAVWGALVLVFEPFVLRINSRVFLETVAGLAVVAGLLILVHHLQRRGARRPTLRLLGAGLCLGYAVFTKDLFAFYAVLPVALAVVWKRTLLFREAAVVLLGSVVPYWIYLVVLSIGGYLGAWGTAKGKGLLRLNAPGAPSLIGRLADQSQHYGTSYLLLLLCPLAGLVAAFSSRPERRFIGLTAVVMGALGGYLAVFGTFEEHFGFPIMVASVTALAVCAAMAVEHRPRRQRLVVALLAVFLAAGSVLALRLELTPDNGFRQFRAWAAIHLPKDARVGVTNDTAVRAFRDAPHFGGWATAEVLEANSARYVLTVSLPTEQGYALARPELLTWLEATETPVFHAEGPTNGELVLWRLHPDKLAAAATRGVGGPPPAALDAGTAGSAVGGGRGTG
jgi:hypothetical protein